jgi:type I restriction enzyme R subunit
MSNFTESDVEEAALYYFEQLDYTVLSGPDIAPDAPQAERTSYRRVILEGRLRSALAQLTRKFPPQLWMTWCGSTPLRNSKPP